jgi:translocation and assembly module TamB
MSAPRTHLAGRLAAHAAKTLGAVVVFVTALLAGVVLHLDHPTARAFAARETEVALATLFQGQVLVERPAHLGLLGLDGGAGKVVAPDGKVVLRVSGVRARADVLAIVHSVVLGKGPMSIPIADVGVDYAEVVLDATKDGASEIAAAFARKLPIPPRSPDARGVELAMEHITVRHAWVHGQVPGTPPTDADVDDVVGSVHLHAGTLHVDVTHYLVRTRGAPNGLDAEGNGDFHLTHPSPRGKVGLEGSFAGTVGGIGAAMKAALDGPRVDVTLDVPRAPAERVRALFANAPANAELGLRLDAHGELPVLDVDAQVTLGKGTLHAKGPVNVEGNRHASLAWDATSLDLRAFSQAAPETSLQGKGTVDVNVAADAAFAGSFTADVGAGTVSGKALPPAALHGTFAKSAAGLHAHAEGRVDEAGAPTDVVLDASPDGDGWELDGTAHAKIPRLDAVTRLGTQLRGAADVRASYKLHTKTSTVDATLHADVRGFEQGTQKVGHADVSARVTGKLASPAISTTTKATDLFVGTYDFPSATLTTHGTTKAQHVDASFVGKDTPDIKGTAEISVGAKTTVKDVDLSLERNDQKVAVRVPTIRFGNGELLVEDAVVRGLGAPVRASLDIREKSTTIRARSRSVSLARLGHLLHFEDGSLDGRVDFDVDLLLDADGAHGKASASLAKAVVKQRAAIATLQATADGHRWSAAATGSLAGVGTVALTTNDLALGPGGPLRATGWQGATGTVGVRGTFDLAELASLAPKGTLSFAPSGTLDVSGVAERTGAAHDVSLNLAALTHSLEVTTASGRHVSGIEAQVGANLDGSIGGAAGVLVLTDANGQVARLDLQSDAVPYRALWAAPDLGTRLLAVPLVATLTVPPRDVDKLPAGFALKDAHGTVQLVATLSGSVAAAR